MGHKSARGFTLIEIVVVLLIFGVVIAMAAAITRGVVASQKRSITASRMAGIDSALVQFVQQTKRLPCPADGTLASSANNAGIEAGGGGAACNNNQQDGVIPWRTLGLTESDATDGWDRRLTYRVTPTAALNGGMDMSACDPAGTEGPGTPPQGCTPGCTSANLVACTQPSSFLAGKGLQVRNVAGEVLMNPAAAPNTGAAYVLISHGESGGGGYTSAGVLAASSVGDGTEEQRNYASLPFTAGVTYYVDNALNEVNDATHFDDIVSRPTVMAIASRASLGPRSH